MNIQCLYGSLRPPPETPPLLLSHKTLRSYTCDRHTTPGGGWVFLGWGGVSTHSTFAGETFQSISDQKTARLASKGDFPLIFLKSRAATVI